MESSVEKGAKRNLWPFILTFISVCVIAVGYIAMWIVNTARYGMGFSNSDMIKTTTGRIISSVIYSVILVACLFAIFYAVRLYLKKDHPAVAISRISWLPRILSIFALLACVDAFFIFFYTSVANAVVAGETAQFNNNFQIIEAVSNYLGYDGLAYLDVADCSCFLPASKLPEGFEKCYCCVANAGKNNLVCSVKNGCRCNLSCHIAGLEDSAFALISAILFGLIVIAVCALTFFLYIKIKAYYDVLMNTAAGAQYDKGNKPPIVLSIIIAAVNVVLAVISFIAGNWVDAIIQIGTAMFLGAGAWMFAVVHKELRASSVD